MHAHNWAQFGILAALGLLSILVVVGSVALRIFCRAGLRGCERNQPGSAR